MKTSKCYFPMYIRKIRTSCIFDQYFRFSHHTTILSCIIRFRGYRQNTTRPHQSNCQIGSEFTPGCESCSGKSSFLTDCYKRTVKSMFVSLWGISESFVAMKYWSTYGSHSKGSTAIFNNSPRALNFFKKSKMTQPLLNFHLSKFMNLPWFTVIHFKYTKI